MGKETKILWFSRHAMKPEQEFALVKKFGAIRINQINKTINNAFELKEDIDNADVIAIVAPIGIQQQFLQIAGVRPVISAVSRRVLIPQENGEEDKIDFQFVKWERLIKIEVIKEDFA